MSIQDTITQLEQEIDAIEQRRGELEKAIEVLRPLADDTPVHRAAGRKLSAASMRRGSVKRGKKISGRRALNKTDGRTDGRTEQGPRQRAARSLPDYGDMREAILAALRAKSPQRPSELAERLKVARPALTFQMKPLLKAGAVVATGATMNRQFSLPPGKRPAKEVP